MNARERLPDKRPSISFDFEVGTLRYTATVSRYADGRIGEIFIQNSKPGSSSDNYARDGAIAASLAMQHGCSLDVLRRAVLRDPQGRASIRRGAALDLIAEMEGGR